MARQKGAFATTLAATAVAALLLSGCVEANRPASPPPDLATPTASSTIASGASLPEPTTSSSSEASMPPDPSALPNVIGEGVTRTVVDGLRVRSLPSVGKESAKRVPLLPSDTILFAVEGPVSGSGYNWYDVVPLDSRTLPHGWVAEAARDGSRWLTEATFPCPAVPTTFESLSRLVPGVGLACFPRVPITVQARLIACNCDIDGPPSTPDWLFVGGGSPMLLVDPGDARPPANWSDWFVVHLDPAGRAPASLPVGDIVEVTGMFDHPSATGCTVTDFDALPMPTHECRLAFAITTLAPART